MPTPPLVILGNTNIPAALLSNSLWFGLIASQFFSAVLTLASISALLAAMEAALAKRAMMVKPVAAYKYLAFITSISNCLFNLGLENLFVENPAQANRSEERRVGKECRSRW